MEYTVEVNDAPHTYIAQSSVDGRGLFAAIDFMQGDIVVDFGNANYWRETEYQELTVEEKIRRWLVMLTPTTCLVSKTCSNFSFINHSENPNTFIDLPNRRVVALKDIAKDEEITFDYTAQPVAEGEIFPNWE